MTTVPSVDAEPGVVATPPAGRAIPPRVAEAIASAGFPPELGDPASLFRYTRLDTQNPTVSHLLVNGGLSAYNRFGQSIQRATIAMNRAENARWSMNTIRGEFLFLDPQALANAPAPVRASAMAAFDRLTQQLGGEVATPPAANTDADTVERGTTPRGTITGPRPQQVDLPTPGTSRPSPLPQHAALEGITDDYRAWLTRGDNRMRTVEALLGQRPESFEAGLTSVQERYGLGTDGRPRNIQEAAQRLQTELGVPGRPDGKFGPVSTPYLTAARERYSAQAATPEGQEQVRTELAGKETLQAAISPDLGANPPTPEPARDPEPVPTVPVVEERQPTVPATPPVEVQGSPQATPYQDLAAWRTSDPAKYTELRDRMLSGARGNPATMMTLYTDARAVSPEVATDLANTWLDAHTPSALNPDQAMIQARREFARQMSRDTNVASLPAALNDRFARILAPGWPGGPGLSAPPAAQDLPALAVFENNRVNRARTSADLLDDDRNRYATFMWADPGVVAARITALSERNLDVAGDFGTAFAKHLHATPTPALDARVDALRRIFVALPADRQARVDEGMRDMGRFGWTFGLIRGIEPNLGGIAGFLVDRVTKPR